MTSTTDHDAAVPASQVPSFAEAFRVWARIGCLSFGGPAGQIALMHKELVEERRWIGEQRFLHALNYCMLLPGPEATQLAIYIGWLMHRTLGGVIAGVLFVLPSLLLLIGLSWAYMAYGSLPAIAGILYGMKPAVVAIVLGAAWRIGKRTLRNRPLMAIALAAFIAISFIKLPFPAIVAGAALLGWIGGRLHVHRRGRNLDGIDPMRPTIQGHRGPDKMRSPCQPGQHRARFLQIPRFSQRQAIRFDHRIAADHQVVRPLLSHGSGLLQGEARDLFKGRQAGNRLLFEGGRGHLKGQSQQREQFMTAG